MIDAEQDLGRERYERMWAAKNPPPGLPPKTLAEIGAEEGITKERVRQILKAGPPRRNGRPPNPNRRSELEAKLALWQERRAEAVGLGKGTTYIDDRIGAVEDELARVSA